MDSPGCFQIICNIENFEEGMQNVITSLHGKAFVWTWWKRFALFKKWFRWFRNVTCIVSFKYLPRINFSSIWLKKLLHFYVIPFLFLAIKMTHSACLPMLERSISSLHILHLDLSSFFELTNHDLNLPSSNHFWLNIVCFTLFQLKQHTKVNIHWFFIRNTIFKNMRLRLSNLAKEKKNWIWAKKFP